MADSHTKGVKQIPDVSHLVQNDEDSGVGTVGHDYLNDHLKV
ncbi:hypothetical protein [Candidatus Nitrosotalea okcheonensis]|uniref:Uncharacterized protein n=1 Tax=Candidatus Nitrosotalea okcheonensis TaxID=1903276 RepID=A0A2H1FDE0_9ARCH|nr:hypothetical protein [Candidatus Nitrosotalea okcheonensis]SMH70775.1 protein of unknown function [Candidatus Nitrosotalea okcheonensis]